MWFISTWIESKMLWFQITEFLRPTFSTWKYFRAQNVRNFFCLQGFNFHYLLRDATVSHCRKYMTYPLWSWRYLRSPDWVWYYVRLGFRWYSMSPLQFSHLCYTQNQHSFCYHFSNSWRGITDHCVPVYQWKCSLCYHSWWYCRPTAHYLLQDSSTL